MPATLPTPTPTVDATVPKLWPGATVVCLGTGPSLTAADVNAVRGKARVIAINDAYKLAPWADVFYACDLKWWNWHHHAVTGLDGLKYGLTVKGYADVQRLQYDEKTPGGVDLRPTHLRKGWGSGYQAINLAVHLGAAKIVLLGYDMHGLHFFGMHRDQVAPPCRTWLPHAPTLVAPLQSLGIEIVNCSRSTALTCFPRKPLAEVLP